MTIDSRTHGVAVEQKRVVDPENFLPKLPQREELRPFPTVMGMEYLGHAKRVRSVSFDPTGQFFASGSEDCTVRIWEVRPCCRQALLL
jgi:ribosome biogenesis protein ERB1